MGSAQTKGDFYASQSFTDIKSVGSGGAGSTQNDILFLKRLLFLKASLDNETQFNSFAVPFEEEQAFKQQ